MRLQNRRDDNSFDHPRNLSSYSLWLECTFWHFEVLCSPTWRHTYERHHFISFTLVGNCVLLLLAYVSQISRPVEVSQALVSSSRLTIPSLPDGGRCCGQTSKMWSTVCSGAPHSHTESGNSSPSVAPSRCSSHTSSSSLCALWTANKKKHLKLNVFGET